MFTVIRTLMGSKMIRKLCLVMIVAMFAALGTVYVAYFHHAPTNEILLQNKASHDRVYSGGDIGAEKDSRGHFDPAILQKYTEEDLNIARYEADKWDAWVEYHGFVSIGEIYDTCGGLDRLMLGRILLLPDERFGGTTLKALVYLNLTFVSELKGGDVSIELRYNGHELYSNKWDACHMEDGWADRVINCPVPRGVNRFYKNLRIPTWLPKGSFSVKSTMHTETGEELLCAYANFSL